MSYNNYFSAVSSAAVRNSEHRATSGLDYDRCRYDDRVDDMDVGCFGTSSYVIDVEAVDDREEENWDW